MNVAWSGFFYCYSIANDKVTLDGNPSAEGFSVPWGDYI